MSKNIKILVVTHKDIDVPNDEMYIPVLVGPNKEKITIPRACRDDQGMNISEKNSNYCELTALYWAWKNLKVEYVGLVHYRRFFMSLRNKKNILESTELNSYLDNVDLILPKKRNYYIESTWSHYEHNHNIEDLKEVKKIISRNFPDYIDSFDLVMSQNKGHRFNMFIMKTDVFNDYAEWLFSILFELEERIDTSGYNQYQSRVYGFISERLLDVWLDKNCISYKEIPYKFMEKQNWIIKGGRFVLHKIFN